MALVGVLAVAITVSGLLGRLEASAPAPAARGTLGSLKAVPAPRPSAQPVLWLDPQERQAITGGTVTVDGIATTAVGQVQAEIDLGAASVGTTDTEMRPGPVTLTIPVLAPASATTANLVVIQAGHPEAQPHLRRSLLLQASGPVQLWDAALMQGRMDMWAVLTGYARASTGRLSVTLQTPEAVWLRTSVLPCDRRWRSEQPPVAAVLGVCTFGMRLLVPRSAPQESLVAEVSWLGAADHPGGSLVAPLPTPPGGDSHAGP